MFFLLALVFILVNCSGACPPWTVYSSASGECQCGDVLHDVVHCDRDNKRISLLKCYCMSYNRDFNMTVIGPCNAMCRGMSNDHYHSYNVLMYLY